MEDGIELYTIESIPHVDAPVVWGREVVRVREDHVLLEHSFYDQDNVLVKRLVTGEIKLMSGKHVATVERMTKADAEDEWTEFRMHFIEFGIAVAPGTFSQSNLRNPRF